MAFWLLKSEPDAYSWDQLVADGETDWTGVRNNAAALHLKAMAPGDPALFYHSNTGREAVGLCRITRAHFPDPTDPTGRWVAVGVAPVRPLARAITLAAIRAEPALGQFQLVRQSRLSVVPVRDPEWEVLMAMAGEA